MNIACPYDVDTVYEFYANIPEDFDLEWRNKYGQVYVRGKIYDFDSKIINEFFGLPSVDDEVIQPSQMDEVITVLSGGNTVRWANKLSVSKLSFLYSVLHKVVLYVWLPSSNTSVLTLD